MPSSSLRARIGWRGPSGESEPPWYISGSVQKLSGISRAARLPDQLDMVHIGRAVEPLIGARQGRGAIMLVEAEGRHRAVLQALGEIGQARREALPVVERRLQRRHDREGVGGAGQVAGDDDESAIPTMHKRREFHDFSFLPRHATKGATNLWEETL